MIRAAAVHWKTSPRTDFGEDKTGTLTMGRPVVIDVAAAPAATDRDPAGSGLGGRYHPHVSARAIVTAARARGLLLSLPTEVVEEPGRGVTATLDGRRVQVGRLSPDTANRNGPARW